MKRVLLFASMTAIAAILSACSTLIPPRHLTQGDVAGLSASQLSAAKRYQNRIPTAERKVENATRGYERAQAQYQVADKYWHWRNLGQEDAQKARDLAQARVELLRRQVQLARAQALAQNSNPKQAKQIDVKRYQQRVREQQAYIQDLHHNLQQLQALASAARTNYQSARQALGNNAGSAPQVESNETQQSSSGGSSTSSSSPNGTSQQGGENPGLQTQPLNPSS